MEATDAQFSPKTLVHFQKQERKKKVSGLIFATMANVSFFPVIFFTS